LFAAPPASIGLQTLTDPTPPEKPSIPSLNPRCESCGGPAEKDGDLCASCEQAFHSLLDSTTLAPPAEQEQPQPSAESNPEPVTIEASPELLWASSGAPETLAELPEAPPSARPVDASTSAPPAAVAGSPAASAESTKPEAPKPAPAVARPAVAPHAQPAAKGRGLGMTAAGVVIVAAVGFPLGTYWLRVAVPPPIHAEAQPNEVVTPAPVVEHRPPPAAVAPAPEPKAPPKTEDVKPVPTKAVTPPASRTPAARPQMKPVRQTNPTTTLAASISVPTVSTEVPAAVSMPSAPIAPEPAPLMTPAAPTGPFFETRQVNDVPQVLTKVEPHFPGDAERVTGDIVIVRVLVSQAGHPSLISVLRRSKAGPAVDEAVVAAVKRWTFTPARKRGETVSCWYHVGVPVN
jgi:protein TonB